MFSKLLKEWCSLFGNRWVSSIQISKFKQYCNHLTIASAWPKFIWSNEYWPDYLRIHAVFIHVQNVGTISLDLWLLLECSKWIVPMFLTKRSPPLLIKMKVVWSKHILKAERKLSRKLANFYLPNNDLLCGKFSSHVMAPEFCTSEQYLTWEWGCNPISSHYFR